MGGQIQDTRATVAVGVNDTGKEVLVIAGLYHT
jgi:KaiC/GvpD/RAD55 family RecA-like ATPase